jgi:alpha-tubulin suppressor-like RCC1 family protein
VSAGLQRTCGITTSGAAYCWGGIYGVSLGDGSTTDLSPIPVAVAGGFTWSELSVGTYHTCGVTTSGSAYCWGDNNAAQLGADSASVAAGRTCSPLTCDADARVPVAVAGGLRFTSVQAGLGTTCGIATDGVAYCWGDGGSGELGIGSVTGAETCERKGSGTGEIYSFPCSTTPIAVTGRLAFSDLRMGEGATCGLSSGGALYCWGQGILDGAPSGAAACGGYTDCSTAPVAFGAGLTFASITGATPKGCGVTTAGGAYCWGPNGPLMSDTSATSGSVSPVLVSGGLQFVSVSVSSMWGHACGLTVEWVAYCWGPNQVGQLGDGTATARSTPVKVAGQP